MLCHRPLPRIQGNTKKKIGERASLADLLHSLVMLRVLEIDEEQVAKEHEPQRRAGKPNILENRRPKLSQYANDGYGNAKHGDQIVMFFSSHW